MKIIKVISFLLYASTALSQTQLYIRDSETRKPINGAVVFFQSIDGGFNQQAITGPEGEIDLEIELPARYKVSHVSYEDRKGTLQKGQESIELKVSGMQLDDVVVTGQYAPQSASNSVYKVRSIDKERIQFQGATQIQDVLANELNISFNRDNATGSSGISFQGLSGQNVKVLLDGIPIVGRSGISNEVDLSQININSIERIEIVEGPMAVNFGADALAGVINIITKKDARSRIEGQIILHEETVAENYSLFEEGIHMPSLQLSMSPTDNWFVQLQGGLNKFGGWIGNGTDRNRQWYPKQQIQTNGLLRYEKDAFNIYYRTDQLWETLENLGTVNASNPLKDPFAIDEEFIARRNMHQLQSEFQIGGWSLNPVVSFTDYQRTTRQFSKNLVTGAEQQTVAAEQDTIAFRSLFFRNTLVSSQKSWGSIQIGIESTVERADGTTLSDGTKSLEEVMAFISSEFKVGNKLKIRPGVRYGYHSLYTTIPTPSVNFKYAFTKKTNLRFGYGRGFRAPSLREQFHEFIDANHNIIGNADLKPEYSHNLNLDITHDLSKVPVQLAFSGFYNHIDNQITFFTPQVVNAATTYLNLLQFKSVGVQSNARWSTKKWDVRLGSVYTGRFQQISESEDIPQYLFGLQANANVTYRWHQPGLDVSIFYKYTGKVENYVLRGEEPVLTEVGGFSLMDFTLTKRIASWGTLTAGSRNVLNVTNVINTGGGTHGSSGNQSAIGYGRSYFARINITLNVK